MHPGPRPWLEYATYLVLAVGAVGPAIAAGHTVGDGVDMYGTFWFYWWILDCIENLRSPGFTDLLFHPLGKDIFAHTGNNFVDAVVAAPIQALLGYPQYQPWFVILLLLGNALAFRPLARHVLRDGWAAWGATLLWASNPFILFESICGRFTQAMLWFMPLALLHFLKIGRGHKHAVLAGVFTALQAWTYWFMGWFMALAFGWMALVELVRSRERRELLGGYLLAGITCLLLTGPPMALMATHGDVPGLVSGELQDVANNVQKTLHGLQLLETSLNPALTTVVWGGGLVALLLAGRDRVLWVGVAVITFAFAIGPVWHATSGDITMPHYAFAYAHLPFFSRLWFPYRLLSVLMVPVALGLGSLFSRLRTAWFLPLLVLAGNLYEQHGFLAYPLLHRDLAVPAVYHFIGHEGGGLIELPLGIQRESLLFQPVHKQFVFGGMGEGARVLWPEGFEERQRNSFIAFLREACQSPTKERSFNRADEDALVAEGFRWVVLDRKLVDSDLHRWQWYRSASGNQVERAPFLATERIIEKLGQPIAADGPLLVWDLVGGAVPPPDLSPTRKDMSKRGWSTDSMTQYESNLKDKGRLPGRRR